MELDPKELKELELRDEGVHDVLNEIPSILVRHGTTMLLFVFLFITLVLFIVKYPDVIRSELTLYRQEFSHQNEKNIPKNITDLYGIMKVEQRYIGTRYIGEPVNIKLAAINDILDDREIWGNIYKIHNSANSDTSFDIYISLDQDEVMNIDPSLFSKNGLVGYGEVYTKDQTVLSRILKF